MNLLSTDTIVALSTPRGSGGIGIIKISGPEALKIIKKIFQPTASRASRQPSFDHQRMHYGYILHPQEGALDEVLVSVMRAPQSYTTEDVVEVNCHGGMIVTRAILDLVLGLGARLADPGEFTRRAFMGGRIKLSQAEAVADIINAKTRKAARAGLQQLGNGIDAAINLLQVQILNGLAEVETYIDFDDDLEEKVPLTPLADRLIHQTIPAISALSQSYRESRILKDGLRIVIAGRPNVGKSSLVNLLLNQERVIVNPTPGTTRDIIEETIAIDGTPIVITDTAGIHASDDPVETIGIAKTGEAIARADLVLFMVDGSIPVQPEDLTIYQDIKEREHLIVLNKIDLCTGRSGKVRVDWASLGVHVQLSALTGEGLKSLKKRIGELIEKGSDPCGSHVLVNLRQRNLLETAREHLHQACHYLKRSVDAELAVIEIKDSLDALYEIQGEGTTPDVLDQIFQRFCIGK